MAATPAFENPRGSRGYAMEADRVCTWSPFEEGILRAMDGGVGCPTVGLGARRAGAKKLSEGGSLLGYLTARGEAFCCERVGQSSRYSLGAEGSRTRTGAGGADGMS